MANKSNISKALALAALIMMLPSCTEKEQYVRRTGDDVTFSVKTSDSEVSKAAYATPGQGDTEVKINWEKEDLLRIYCAQVSEPADKYADYEVTETGEGGTGNIDVYGEIGLRWGDADKGHVFYAAYPSPAAGGIVKSDTDNTGKTVSASLPATQAVVGNVTGTGTAKVAAPDLKNMLMVATTTVDAGKQSPGDVSLDFRPLTTAIEFTIKNGTGSDMKLKSVSLISGDKKSSAPAINGDFSVNLSTSWKTPAEVTPFPDDAPTFKITYAKTYPACTRASEMESTTDKDGLRTSKINFSEKINDKVVSYVTVANGNTLTFTFFLVPTCDYFNDLTLKLTYDGGSWMSYRLCYTDDTGIIFPKFKRTAVTGLLVPEGAQWTVRYAPGVNPWVSGQTGNLDMKTE